MRTATVPGFILVPLRLEGQTQSAMRRPVPIGRHCAAAARLGTLVFGWFVLLALAVRPISAGPSQRSTSPLPSVVTSVVDTYCVRCHDGEVKKGGLDLERISREALTEHSPEWEHVIRKLRARQMPPIGKDRPSDKTYDEVVARLATPLDRAAAKNPAPGRTETFRRLNRTEYHNAIRDLLAVDIDATTLLPKDDLNQGFDNVGSANLSPTLLSRYIAAAEKISRLAVGNPRRTPGGDTFRVRPDLTQEGHVDGLPLGTRGGLLVPYTFPRDGEYEVQIRLTRDRNEVVEGLDEPHELELLVDRQQVKSFTVEPPKNKDY